MLKEIEEKLEKAITEKSEKIMTNEKVEGFVNNLGGVLCFAGAVVFGIMFIVGGASLMKTGKNYVVKPPPAEEKKAEEAAPESTTTEESPATEEATTAEPSAEQSQ